MNPFFKQEDADLVLMVAPDGSFWEQGKPALSIEEANRLVEPLQNELEVTKKCLFQAQEMAKEFAQKYDRLRAELAEQKQTELGFLKEAKMHLDEYAALRKQIEDAPTVYAISTFLPWSKWQADKPDSATHAAKLLDIKPLRESIPANEVRDEERILSLTKPIEVKVHKRDCFYYNQTVFNCICGGEKE